MSDLQTVVNGAKAIEKVLVDDFGGTGRGLHEKLSTSRIPIPEALQKRIRYVATMRNKSLHEEGFEVDNPAEFGKRCARIVEELHEVHAIYRQTQAARPGSSKRWAWGVGAAALLLLGYLALRPDARLAPVQAPSASAPAPVPVPALPAVSAPAPASASLQNGAPAPLPKPAASPKPTPAASPSAAPRPAPPQTASAGSGHRGIGNDVLTFDAVSLTYKPDAFSRQQPDIEVTVRNNSAITLSHAMLDARLYINGEAEPVLVNGKRAGNSERPLYAGFGDTGLAAGQSRKLRIYTDSLSDWSMPDVLNATSRQLILRVSQVVDGRKNKVGAPAPAFDRPTAATRPTPVASAPAGSAPAPDLAALRQAFRRGSHLAIVSKAVSIENIDFRFTKDAFGAMTPQLEVRVTNQSQVTLSSIQLDAALFVGDERNPIASTQKRGGDRLYLFFGQAGLAAGATTKASVTFSRLDSDWKSPDVLNATKRQLVIRTARIIDGRQQEVKVEAPALDAVIAPG